MSEANIGRGIDDSCLMDDLFFELFFKNDPKYIEVVIREIFMHLNRPLVKIVSVSTQHNLKTKNGFDYVTISTISLYPESKVRELRDRFIKEGLLPA